MLALRSAAAVPRFFLELVLLAVFGAFGFTFPSPWSWILGLGIPALTLLVWSAFVAPRAPRHLEDPARLVVELGLFALGMGALAAIGQWPRGVALFVVFAIDRLVLDRWGKPAWAEPRLR